MALYRVANVHEGIAAPYLGLRWRNIYTIEAASYDAALAAGDVIGVYESTFHTDKTRIFRVTAHGVFEPPRRAGAVMEVNRPGEYSPVGDAWPLWNCVRADFPDVGLGRPERKYYRVGLHDGMVQADLTLLGTYRSIFFGGVENILSVANFVGPSGEAHSGAPGINESVQMRQIGWHRRTRPGFRRGYVAV